MQVVDSAVDADLIGADEKTEMEECREEHTKDFQDI